MKKCVLFLINGLGIEKPGSYSISIDQAMPQLCKIKETSYFTSAITSSLEYRDAYQRFFLGDTYKSELEYLKNNVLNSSLVNNPTFQSLGAVAQTPNTKLHIFLEPTNDQIIEQVNSLLKMLPLDQNKKVYLHLVLFQQTIAEYDKIINMINYIKFHLDERMTVGFVMGKEYLPDTLGKVDLDYVKKLFFYCSAERWTETEKKLQDLKIHNVRPCEVQGFCTNNDCFIANDDTILFFNTRRNNYDNLLQGIYQMAPEVYKVAPNLPVYSLIKLNSQYTIPCFVENVDYDTSLSNLLAKYNKKALIFSDKENIKLVNFYANGLNDVNNPNIGFMMKDDRLFQPDYIRQLIEDAPYDIYIFDYHMDVSKTINHLKEQFAKLDVIIGALGDVCVNKHSLIITSLYGLKKELPLADYDPATVLIDYEMQIPIFFFDYNYPKGKYHLSPGETNDILMTALRCITGDPNVYSLVKERGLLNNLMKAFK